MPPKPPIRLPAKPPTAPKAFAKPSLPVRPANPAPRTPHPSKPTPATPSRTAPPPPPPRWHETARARTGGRYLKWGTNGIVAICALLWIRDHFIEIQHVRGSSMAPTLSPDAHETGREDYVIVRPYQERRDGKKRNVKGDKGENGKDGAIFWGVKRGDVVTFWKPHKPGEMGIKRVVAVEGDTVYPTRGYALDPQSFQNRLKGVPDGLPDHDEDSVAGRDGEEVGEGGQGLEGLVGAEGGGG
ncbi:hypothetical protein J4E86_003851 [Alternaria arbusti]|uniref:uncharacterized protein n=1 Tax=Alternaria arbusti TaxID=232088 RepID=UPI0022206AB1|nr:uncharacterized protein J4E86_003851 [Alternaria arbusti]KAI4958253.1 hypothetical protein J4E86_003851 [Alternaria arbusti]